MLRYCNPLHSAVHKKPSGQLQLIGNAECNILSDFVTATWHKNMIVPGLKLTESPRQPICSLLYSLQMDWYKQIKSLIFYFCLLLERLIHLTACHLVLLLSLLAYHNCVWCLLKNFVLWNLQHKHIYYSAIEKHCPSDCQLILLAYYCAVKSIQLFST